MFRPPPKKSAKEAGHREPDFEGHDVTVSNYNGEWPEDIQKNLVKYLEMVVPLLWCMPRTTLFQAGRNTMK